MKTNHFLQSLAIFAVLFTFFACSSDSPPAESPNSELSSDSTYEPPSGGPSSGSPYEPPSGGPSSSSNAASNCPPSYLGRGYHVINSSYLNKGSITNSILDSAKLCKDGLISVNETAGNLQKYHSFTTTSIKKLYESDAQTVSLSAGYSAVAFSGKFSTEFKKGDVTNRENNYYYSRWRYYRYTQLDRITQTTNLSNYLSETFKNYLTKPASDIFNNFGTHVLVLYYKGGYLSANYTYKGTKLQDSSTVGYAVNASAKSMGLGPEIGTSYQTSNTTDRQELESESEFNFSACGGDTVALSAQNPKDLFNNSTQYDNWVKDIKNNPDICGILEFDMSLKPIWELVKDVNASKAKELQDYFNQLATDRGLELLVKNLKEDPDGTKEILYGKGSGDYTYNKATKSNPALIEIYALGAGGGGQGGDYNDGLVDNQFGTGGAGGGGGAAYVKMRIEEPISLDITVGGSRAGKGGLPITTGNGATNTSGCDGGNGGDTEVVWSNKMKITATGGKGGNGNSSSVGGSGTCGAGKGNATNGGAGGTPFLTPTSSNLYLDSELSQGGTGDNGDIKNDKGSKGGTAGKITKGSIPFGGEGGGWRPAGAGTTAIQGPGKGGGGSGGSYYNKAPYKGSDGLDGVVNIVVRRFVDE